MKRKISIILCLMLLLMSGCSSVTSSNNEQSTMQKTVVSVEVMEIEKADISSEYIYSGKVTPANEVNVFSTVSGKVSQVNFDIGDNVKKDDILFTMDTEDIVNNINIAKASLVSAEANINSAKTSLELVNGASMQTQIANVKAGVENAKSGVASAEAGISNANIALENAKLTLENAELVFNDTKKSYEDTKKLFESGAVSQSVLDQAKTGYNQAEIGYSQAKLAYEQAKVAYSQAEVGYQQANTALTQAEELYDITVNQAPSENQKQAENALKIAEASKASVEAQLVSYEKMLKDAVIKAPINGIVTAANLKEDTLLSTSSIPFTIIDIDKVNIKVSISEQLINSLKLNQEVEVKVSSVSQDKFKGKIVSINPAANAYGTYDIKIEIENTDHTLKAGMLGEVYFTKEKKENVVVIPRNAVISKSNEDYVFVEENGTARKVIVSLGIDSGENIEITEGLESGMKLIVKGQSYVSDGSEIQVSPALKEE